VSAYITQVAQNWKALLVTTFLIIGLPLGLVIGYRIYQESGPQIPLEPQSVTLLPPGNDPRQIDVNVIWLQNGWCLGQFRAQATETTTQVRLGPVIDHEYPNGPCAGIGSNGRFAYAELKLNAPLGHRSVIRTSDGATLPVLDANTPP
jgi:hypothetical protein